MTHIYYYRHHLFSLALIRPGSPWSPKYNSKKVSKVWNAFMQDGSQCLTADTSLQWLLKLLKKSLRNISLETLENLILLVPNRVKYVYNSRGNYVIKYIYNKHFLAHLEHYFEWCFTFTLYLMKYGYIIIPEYYIRETWYFIYIPANNNYHHFMHIS